MVVRAFFAIVGIGFAIGALFPRTETAAGTASIQLGKPEVQAAAHVKPKPPSNAGVVLKRRANGHFYADVLVNGTNLEFMVDTGASGIALTGRDAEALGLFWTESELETVGRGVSGAVTGKMVRLDRVELGDKEVRDLEAAIIPDGLEVSLLGQNFLSRLREVRIAENEMVLR